MKGWKIDMATLCLTSKDMVPEDVSNGTPCKKGHADLALP